MFVLNEIKKPSVTSASLSDPERYRRGTGVKKTKNIYHTEYAKNAEKSIDKIYRIERILQV